MDDKFHIGVVYGYNIFSKSVKERLTREYMEKTWNPPHREACSIANRELDSFIAAHPEPNNVSRAII